MCNLPFTFTQTFTKDGLAIAQPGWITFDSASTQKFSMASIDPLDVGNYVIT
jgi:hypothetical protein